MTQFWVRSIMTHLVRVADVPLSTHSSTIFLDKLPMSHGHCHCTMGLGNYIISGRAPDGSRQGRFDLRVSKQPAFRCIILTTFSQFMDQIYCRCYTWVLRLHYVIPSCLLHHCPCDRLLHRIPQYCTSIMDGCRLLFRAHPHTNSVSRT